MLMICMLGGDTVFMLGGGARMVMMCASDIGIDGIGTGGCGRGRVMEHSGGVHKDYEGI